MSAFAQDTPTAPATATSTFSGTTCTGTPGAGIGCVVLSVSGYASLSVQIVGITSATLVFEVSNDGVNYSALNLTPPGSTSAVTSTTADGLWVGSVGGLKYARVRSSVYASGTIVVTLQAAQSGGGGGGGGGGGAASSVTINDPSVTSQKMAVNASGQASVVCANCSGSGASAVDEATFTQGTNTVAPAGLLFKTSYTALTTGQVGVLRGFSDGSLFAMGSVASGGTDSGNPIKVGSIFNTTQPTVTTGQRVDFQATARGAQIVATGADTFNVTVNAALPAGTNVIGHTINDSGSTTAVTGNVTAVQATGTNLHAVLDTTSTTAVTQATGTNLHAVLDTTSTTAATQATAANLNAQVQGAAASGASKAGNPVQIGGVFNTTQPTVTTGQAVEAQTTARGAQIVAAGVDAFNVTVNTALPAGSAVIGHVIADSGSTTAVTGTVTVGQATGTNLHAVLDTTSTTAVTQATATNLNAAVVGTGTAGSPAGNILTIQGVGSMTKLLVTPDSVALPANQSVNVAQINGVTPLMGAGATGTGSPRTTDVASSATGAAPPASVGYVGGLISGATGGNLGGITVCDLGKAVNVSTAVTTLIVTGVAGRQVRICAQTLMTTLANNVAWIEGTGATCGTGTAAMAGSTTISYPFAANGGIAQGSGIGEVLTTATTGDSVCLVSSAATSLTGFIKYTIY